MDAGFVTSKKQTTTTSKHHSCWQSFQFRFMWRSYDHVNDCPNVIWTCYLLTYFFIARQHTDARYWYNSSVRPPVTLRYQMKTA